METCLKLENYLEGNKVDNTFLKKIVESLIMYLTAIRAYIMHVISLISKYMENPTEINLLAVKIIFFYLRDSIGFGLFYKKEEKSYLTNFTNSDYIGNQDDGRRTSRYVFMLGTWAISWLSKK